MDGLSSNFNEVPDTLVMSQSNMTIHFSWTSVVRQPLNLRPEWGWIEQRSQGSRSYGFQGPLGSRSRPRSHDQAKPCLSHGMRNLCKPTKIEQSHMIRWTSIFYVCSWFSMGSYGASIWCLAEGRKNVFRGAWRKATPWNPWDLIASVHGIHRH